MKIVVLSSQEGVKVILDLSLITQVILYKGDFTTEIGKYHYKNFGIVERVFDIKKGANISWDGDPYKGIINAEAIYEVPGGKSCSTDTTLLSIENSTSVNILLLGSYQFQTPKFEILFPNTRGSIKSE